VISFVKKKKIAVKTMINKNLYVPLQFFKKYVL
jgi:hypothetical protein